MSNDELELEALDQPMAPAIGEAEQLLERVRDLIGTARPMPLSSSVMVNRDDVVELLEVALERLPEELRHARWMLREREEYLDKVRREGDEILDTARTHAERMVQRSEVVQEAKRTARRVVEAAEEEARTLRREAEDYCDQKLAGFEVVLERTINTVRGGREKLGVSSPLDSAHLRVVPDEPDFPAVFDQDAGPES
ncbi:MAG TPA: hypothetical protein VGA13_03485 [Acidimicrobiales bacterium]|jgi:vacuolar-type H+-ATPase subunit H